MASVRIRVNKRDIENGLPGKPESCPIALAIKRKVKNFESVAVEIDKILLNHNVVSVSNSDKIFAWVWNFDRRWTGKPFSFTLYLP